MLQFDARTLTIEGVTVFRDHADAAQFWYLPGPVALAKREADQRTRFTFLKYKARAGATHPGGGYLMIETQLKLDAEVERRILTRLASISRGRPRLTPAPFDEGTVACVALNLQGSGGTHASAATEGTFNAVESILGATTPSLAGDNNAVFSLQLSAEGATILERALQEGGTPIGVIYDLKYTGLRPAFNVKITADFNQIFTHFSSSTNAQRVFLRVGIDTAFERLERSGAIKIEVADMTGTAENETRIKDALDFFKNQVLGTWFTPVLVPGTLAATPATAATLEEVHTLGVQLRPPATPAPERPPAVPTAPATTNSGPSPTAGTGRGGAPAGVPASPSTAAAAAPAGTGAAATAAAAPDASPTAGSGEPANPTPPPASATARSSSAAATATQAAPMASAADHNSDGAPRQADTVAAFRLRSVRQEERRTATFEYNRAEAQQRSYAPQGFIGLMARGLQRPPYFVEIDLDDPFFQTLSIEAKAPFAFDNVGLKEVHLQLDYGPVSDPVNHRRKDFVFAADDHAAKSVEFAINLRKDRNYAWQAQYHFDPNTEWEGERFMYESPAVTATDDRTLVLNPLEAVGLLTMRIEPGRMDAGLVDFIEVELSYTDLAGWSREKTLRIQAANPQIQEWKLRVSPGSPKVWRYVVHHHLKDGTQQSLAPVSTKATSVVIDDPYPGALDVTIFPVGDFSTVRAAILDVSYADPAHHYTRSERLRLTPETTEAHVRFSTPNPLLKAYRHQLTVIRNDGSTERAPAVDSEEDVISVVF